MRAFNHDDWIDDGQRVHQWLVRHSNSYLVQTYQGNKYTTTLNTHSHGQYEEIIWSLSGTRARDACFVVCENDFHWNAIDLCIVYRSHVNCNALDWGV